MELPIDSSNYLVDAQILRDLAIISLRLVTDSPGKNQTLVTLDLNVVECLPLLASPPTGNRDYLATKREDLRAI